MCRRCEPNHKVDVPVCITFGGGLTTGSAWVFAHTYVGQPFIETLKPVGITTAIFAVIGILVGIVIWRWEQQACG